MAKRKRIRTLSIYVDRYDLHKALKGELKEFDLGIMNLKDISYDFVILKTSDSIDSPKISVDYLGVQATQTGYKVLLGKVLKELNI